VINKAKVIVADDEVHILHVVAVKLRAAGYEVITARNGEELFDQTQTELPDLIITDLDMPRLSGLEVCQRLRHIPRTASIPAILLGAPGFQLTEETREHAGITACFDKPFDTATLMAAVDGILVPAAV
jgi:two-component system alkaline phosphatase synthesis response regulator PhoP